MMSRHLNLLKNCQRIATTSCTSNGKVTLSFKDLLSGELPRSVASSWFSIHARKCEDFRIVDNDFDESKYSIDEDPLDEDFEKPQKILRRNVYDNERGFAFSQKSRTPRGLSNERQATVSKYQDSDDYNFQSRKKNFSHHGRRSLRWVQDKHLTNSDDNESLDSFIRETSPRERSYPREQRTSMEDLWNQVREHKIEFDSGETIEKNFYNEHPDVSNRPQEEIRKFMDSHQMTVTGSKSRKPVLNFEETGFPDEIVAALKYKFDEPTPIQCIGWPHALSGCDVVGIAQTGSGKTLSFILPGILHILKRGRDAKGNGPIALVMCPTRELAIQCHETVKQFRRLANIRSAVVYGGQSKLVQAEKLIRPGLDMVIATPGRLLDFLSTNTLSLQRCSFLVMDEADRMLDMGFEPQIRAIMGQIRPDRQVLMWSATWPEEIQDLASDFLKDYVHVKIGAQTRTVNSDISQEFHYSTPNEKIDLLLDHLSNSSSHVGDRRKPAKTLIFCGTKDHCSRLRGIVRRNGFYCDIIHGDRTQKQRDEVMQNFRTGRTTVLIASDVASRGIDVTDIEYVINYDLPNNIDSYIHRVGRTGRAGRKGTAISFITVRDLEMTKPLVEVLQDVGHEVPDLLYQLLHKRNALKSYRKMDRRSERRRWTDRKQIPEFRF